MQPRDIGLDSNSETRRTTETRSVNDLVVIFALRRHDPCRNRGNKHYDAQENQSGRHEVIACGLSGKRFCGKNEGVHEGEDTNEAMARTM